MFYKAKRICYTALTRSQVSWMFDLILNSFEALDKLFSVKLVHLTFSFTFLNPTSAKDQNQMQFVLPNWNISTCCIKMRYYFGGGLVGAS